MESPVSDTLPAKEVVMVPAKSESSAMDAAISLSVSKAAGATATTSAIRSSTYFLVAASWLLVGSATLVIAAVVTSTVPLTVKLFRVVDPEDAVTLPVKSPVKPVVASTVVPLIVVWEEAPMVVPSIVPEPMSTLDTTTAPVPAGVTLMLPLASVEDRVRPSNFRLSTAREVATSVAPIDTPSSVPEVAVICLEFSHTPAVAFQRRPSPSPTEVISTSCTSSSSHPLLTLT